MSTRQRDTLQESAFLPRSLKGQSHVKSIDKFDWQLNTGEANENNDNSNNIRAQQDTKELPARRKEEIQVESGEEVETSRVQSLISASVKP